MERIEIEPLTFLIRSELPL